MQRILLALALLALCVSVSAQDWVEHGGSEYNCDVLNGILADYGHRDLARRSGTVTTVAELFALFFPSCPIAADAVSRKTPADRGDNSSQALFSFNSDEAGLQPALGPLVFPAGIYVVTLTTEDYMTVGSETLSGDCGSDLSYSLIGVSAGEGSDGAQDVIEVEAECSVMLDVDLVNEAWTLEIVSANSRTKLPASDSYSFKSDEAGVQPVIGPLTIGAGIYVVTLTTEDYMTVGSVVMAGDCGSDLSYSLIGVSAGEGSAGAQDVIEVEAECSVMLDVDLVDKAWTLEIDKVS